MRVPTSMVKITYNENLQPLTMNLSTFMAVVASREDRLKYRYVGREGLTLVVQNSSIKEE